MKILFLVFSLLFWFSEFASAEELPLITLKSIHGIEFTYLRSDLQDTISVSIAFKGGMASDDVNGPATAYLAPALMAASAGGKTNSEMFEAFSDVGGSFSLAANTDQTYAELSAPSKGILGAAKLANLVLTKPDFPEKKFLRRRADLAARVEESAAYPETAMQVAFNFAVAEPHPYQNYFSPTANSLRSVAQSDLRPWVAKHITRDRILVAVVGNLNYDQAREIVDQVLDGLPEKSDLPETPRMQFKSAPVQPIQVAFDTGDQAILNFGMAQNFRADLKQWIAVSMLSQIFVGDQKSRLFKNIRESSGATYGLQPNLAFYEAMLVNGVTGRIAKDKVDETIALVQKSWTKFREDGPTDEEIANARANMHQLIGNVSRDHTRLSGFIRDYLTGHWTASEISHLLALIDEIDLKDKTMLQDLFPVNPIIVIAQ